MEPLPALDRRRRLGGRARGVAARGRPGGRLDWGTHYVDGTYVDATVVRAHQHAAGAVGGQASEALGRSGGGFSTKIHVRAEGGGKPMGFVVSGGERHESLYLRARARIADCLTA